MTDLANVSIPVEADVLRLALLPKTLAVARDESEIYAELYGGIALEEIRSLADLSCLPTTDRVMLQRRPRAFFVRSRAPSIIQHTSGSTGEPLVVYRSAEEVQSIREFFSAVYSRNPPPECHLILSLTVPVHGTATPLPTSHHVLNGWAGDAQSMAVTINMLQRTFDAQSLPARVTVLVGSSVDLIELTQRWIELNCPGSALAHIQVFGGYVTERWRTRIERAWGVALGERYSLSEVFGGATRCRRCGGYHFDPYVIPEVLHLHDDAPIADGRGELALTTLYPFVQLMPLLRYRTGDIFERRALGCTSPSFHYLGRRGRCMIDQGRLLATEVDIIEVLDHCDHVARVPLRQGDLPRFTLEMRNDSRVPVFHLDVSMCPAFRRAEMERLSMALSSSLLARADSLACAVADGRARLDISFSPGLGDGTTTNAPPH